MFVLANLILSTNTSVDATETNEAAIARLGILKFALANSRVRLCQAPFVFAQGTTKASAVAAEADYDGYTSGGNTITAWGDPLLQTGGGAAIAAETTFAYVDGMTHTANTISSGWVELAGGSLVLPFNLSAPITLQNNGDGFVLQLLNSEGAP